MKGFKYQITVTFLLSKHKINVDIECAPVYFKSGTKMVISSDKYMLHNINPFNKFYTE